MSDDVHDIVVIGGGPAGSAAAIALAETGQTVRLLERKTGAHHKVCGEFISWEAAHYLRSLGLDLSALGALPIHRAVLYNGDDEVTTQLPDIAWSLSRHQLDEALLQRAQQSGVDVRRGVAVRALTRSHSHWNLTLGGHGLADKQAGMCANTVFLANGKHDLRHWQRTGKHTGSEMLGLKMHLRLSPPQQSIVQNAVEVYLYNGGYAGLEPIEGGKANLCFVLNKRIFQMCDKQWPQVLAWLSGQCPQLKNRLHDAQSLWQQPLAISAVPYGYCHPPAKAVPELFRLGDQTAVIPSFAGDGIAIALYSAHLATQEYATGGSSRTYQRQAQRHLYQPVRDAQILSRMLASRPGRCAAFGLARQWPGLLSAAISRLRVGL